MFTAPVEELQSDGVCEYHSACSGLEARTKFVSRASCFLHNVRISVSECESKKERESVISDGKGAGSEGWNGPQSSLYRRNPYERRHQ